MASAYRILDRQPRVGDDVLIMDEIVRVVGIIPTRSGEIDQVIVERQGEIFSISPFETDIEVVEDDS